MGQKSYSIGCRGVASILSGPKGHIDRILIGHLKKIHNHLEFHSAYQ